MSSFHFYAYMASLILLILIVGYFLWFVVSNPVVPPVTNDDNYVNLANAFTELFEFCNEEIDLDFTRTAPYSLLLRLRAYSSDPVVYNTLKERDLID